VGWWSGGVVGIVDGVSEANFAYGELGTPHTVKSSELPSLCKVLLNLDFFASFVVARTF